MKIPLNMNQDGPQSRKAAQAKMLERDIAMTKKGDWNAKNSLMKTFIPLLQSLAEKRTDDIRDINEYIEAGKNGLLKAAKKYKPTLGADKFQIFALDFIENAMDNMNSKGGFFSKLFGK